jgi:hypothetical protein
MRFFLAIVSAALITNSAFSQTKVKVQSPNTTVQVQAGQGKVVTGKPNRFDRPVTNVPNNRPHDTKPGHSWHWHPHYGWVLLPVNTVQTVVLPESYALPQQVTYYQPQQAQCTCPHCGKMFFIVVH